MLQSQCSSHTCVQSSLEWITLTRKNSCKVFRQRRQQTDEKKKRKRKAAKRSSSVRNKKRKGRRFCVLILLPMHSCPSCKYRRSMSSMKDLLLSFHRNLQDEVRVWVKEGTDRLTQTPCFILEPDEKSQEKERKGCLLLKKYACSTTYIQQ